MVIYKITNLIDGKVYIGQTTQTIDARIREHKKRIKSGRDCPLYSAIRVFGWEAFSIEVIDKAATRTELNEKEVYWIAKYNCVTPLGYNLTKGGSGTLGYRHTDKDKSKMRALKQGMYEGENNPFYGKHHSKEQIEKWKSQRKGRQLTQTWKENISKTRKRIPIVDIDTGEVFESARHVARYYGKNPDHGSSGSVSKVCRKVPKFITFCGHRFEFYDPLIHDNTVPNLHFLKEGVTTIREE